MRRARSIPINPGGGLALEHIVGRNETRDEVLESLETRSVVLTGERRMGKTSLSKLIEDTAPSEGWTVARLSVQGYKNLEQLTKALILAFDQLGGPLRRAARSFGKRLSFQAGGVTLAPDSSMPDLDEVVTAAVMESDNRLLLILDELPLFVREANRRTGTEADGTATLDMLRRLRESNPGLRLLCLGSVGFHHVLGTASGVLNDTERVRLSPLSCTGEDSDAAYLARCLLHGIDVNAGTEVADCIALEVEGVPFYVHKVAQSLERMPGAAVTDEDIRALVERALTAPDDPWELRHYRTRIELYYGDDAALARAVLDGVAASEESVDLPTVYRRVAADQHLAPVDEERVASILERLEDDHYLVRDGGDVGSRSASFDGPGLSFAHERDTHSSSHAPRVHTDRGSPRGAHRAHDRPLRCRRAARRTVALSSKIG